MDTHTSSSYKLQPPTLLKRVRRSKVTKADFERVCGVCGDKATNYNYGAVSCESCKMFFRRSCTKSQNLQCVQDHPGKCSVALAERRSCSACRLMKCLEIGMRCDVSDDPKKSSICPSRQLPQEDVSESEPGLSLLLENGRQHFLHATDVTSLSIEIVRFFKLLRPFQQLSQEQQIQLVVTRLGVLLAYTCLWHAALNPSASLPVELNVIAVHKEFLKEFLQNVGTSPRARAIFLAMKVFEMHPGHEAYLGEQLQSHCQTAFSTYAGRMTSLLKQDALDAACKADMVKTRFNCLYDQTRWELDWTAIQNVKLFQTSIMAEKLLDILISDSS